MQNSPKSARREVREHLARYGLALLAAAGAIFLRTALDPLIGDRSHLLIFTLGVFVAARFGGIGPGLAATVVCGLVGWYFFTEPRHTFQIASPADGLNLLVFAGCGGIISLFCEQLRRALFRSRHNEVQLRRFAELAPIAVAMFDREMRYLAASERYRQTHRLPSRVEGRSHYELIPEIPERWKQVHQRVLAGSVERSAEDLFEHPDGRVEWLRWEMRPWHHADGAIGGALLATEDITFQKEAEVALRESEQRFRALFEHAADGIFIATPDGRYVEVNARGLEMSGYRRDELLRMHIMDFVAPADRDRVAQETETVISGRRSFGAWHFLRKDGSLFEGEVSARLLPDGRLLAIVRDLTERRRLEAQFLQAQKLEGIGRLAGGVAHDFNNLLTIISGYSQMALDETPPNDPLAESLDEILNASRRASSLTRQLLAFSRRQIIEPKDLDINELVRNFEKMLRRLIGEDIELSLSLSPDTALFRADPGQIEQVLLNLAVNARDAMPLGGKLVIETASFDADREFSEGHLSVPPGRYVMLSVGDNGVGMSKEVQAHLFEPFFTTKDPGKGTGLGLSTVYGIVQQSGGSILVYSEPGLGTAFRMLFPAVAGSVRTAPEPAPVTDQSGTETILLVEDEPSVRKYVSQVLRRRGYVVLEATNGKEGLELAARNEGKIDLLLTDLVMPEMGGAELAARFRDESARNIPVLCVSGYTDRLWRPEDPNVSFLQKPFTISALLTRIRELLAARKSASA